MSGYSTIHEEQTYDLEELWRFHEKLKGARIACKDWREAIQDSDGAGALFFLDPPYVGEWGTDEGIPPEEIAREAVKLKGEFLVAYTDSARARRAFARAGRLFKMKFLEARDRGLWAKRNRLFVAPFDVKKAEDLEWIEAAEGAARFVLQYQYFRKRGEKPVRAGPTTWHYDLRLDAGEPTLRHWVLDQDLTRADETVGYFKRDPDKRALEAEGFFPPGSFMNPTKDTPSFVEIVDRGDTRILVDEAGLLKVTFEGKALRGNLPIASGESRPVARARLQDLRVGPEAPRFRGRIDAPSRRAMEVERHVDPGAAAVLHGGVDLAQRRLVDPARIRAARPDAIVERQTDVEERGGFAAG